MNAILTPPVISKLPLGLLGFFGIKNGGKYPQTLGDVIVPEMEMLELLAANYHANYVYIASPNAGGFFQATSAIAGTPQSVPAGELWYISSSGMQWSTAAGDSLTEVAAVVRGSQFGAASAFYRVISPAFTQAANTNVMRQCDKGFWMEPGDIFGFWAQNAVLAGSIIINIQVKVTRFPF